MNFRSYKERHLSASVRQIFARSSTLFFFKKAVSSFMPRNKMIWDTIRKESNPTQSSKVNELITKIKKFKVIKEGGQEGLEFDEF